MYRFERINGKLRLCIDINRVASKLKIHPEILRWILVFKFRVPFPGDCIEVEKYNSSYFHQLVNKLETVLQLITI